MRYTLFAICFVSGLYILSYIAAFVAAVAVIIAIKAVFGMEKSRARFFLFFSFYPYKLTLPQHVSVYRKPLNRKI